MENPTISPKELKEKLDNKEDIFLLDVRNQNEYKLARINNSILIPLPNLEKNLGKIPKNKEIIVYCHHGNRSSEATKILKEKGFDAKSLVGGIDVWSRFIDKNIPQY